MVEIEKEGFWVLTSWTPREPTINAPRKPANTAVILLLLTVVDTLLDIIVM